MGRGGLVKAVEALLVLLVVSHIGINFVAPLPPFLVAENIVYAVLYAIAVYGVARGSRGALLLASLVSAFEAGRVSRSIVSPWGKVGSLALQHVPLLSLLLLTTILATLAGERLLHEHHSV